MGISNISISYSIFNFNDVINQALPRYITNAYIIIKTNGNVEIIMSSIELAVQKHALSKISIFGYEFTEQLHVKVSMTMIKLEISSDGKLQLLFN